MTEQEKKAIIQLLDNNPNFRINFIEKFAEFCDANKIKYINLINNIKKDVPLFYPKLTLSNKFDENKIMKQQIIEAIDNNDGEWNHNYNLDNICVVSLNKNLQKAVIIPNVGKIEKTMNHISDIKKIFANNIQSINKHEYLNSYIIKFKKPISLPDFEKIYN